MIFLIMVFVTVNRSLAASVSRSVSYRIIFKQTFACHCYCLCRCPLLCLFSFKCLVLSVGLVVRVGSERMSTTFTWQACVCPLVCVMLIKFPGLAKQSELFGCKWPATRLPFQISLDAARMIDAHHTRNSN